MESLNDLWNKIRKMFAESKSDIDAKIDACKMELEQKIGGVEHQLSNLKTDSEIEIREVSGSVAAVRDDLEITRMNVNRIGASNDLIVSGIPYTSDENIMQIFLNISKALSYNPSDVPMVYLKRLSKVPIAVGSAPPIMCQFSLRGMRDEFYGRYLRQKSLNLQHLGFINQNRVYINENLAPEDREIRTQAIKLKKQYRIQQVFTRNGVVFVRVKTGDDAVPYYTLEQQASVN